MANRLVVFTENLSPGLRKGIVDIDRALPGLQWLVVIRTPVTNPRRMLRNQWRHLRRNGWRWIPFQVARLPGRLMDRLAAPPAPSPLACDLSDDALAARPGLSIIRVTDIHAPDTIETVKAFRPDVGISWGAPILRRSLFAVPSLGTVNLHQGKVPDYRGMPPAFWELMSDEIRVGCTVHRMDDALDTGEIITQTSIEIEPFSTLAGLQMRLDETGIGLMREAVDSLLSGPARTVPQPDGGQTWRRPTLKQISELGRKLERRQPPVRSLTRQWAKNVIGASAITVRKTVLGRIPRPRATVLLYHRVSDSARDDLTVGIEQFDRQMSLLRRHCEPISLHRLLALDAVPRTRKPLVAVTFDDGYLDNYTNAVPALVRHGIPAAFFVSTRIIGTDRRFPHDIVRGNPPIPVMEWDHLREMRDLGFLIGSHTATHIDCAAEADEAVTAELALSLEDIRSELGTADVIFAYPYGGRQHMTPERLERVKEAGYSACLSAYGGSNAGAVDRFDVRRKGIHWEYSDPAFLFQCLGLG